MLKSGFSFSLVQWQFYAEVLKDWSWAKSD